MFPYAVKKSIIPYNTSHLYYVYSTDVLINSHGNRIYIYKITLRLYTSGFLWAPKSLSANIDVWGSFDK